jgi:hypothetical protein
MNHLTFKERIQRARTFKARVSVGIIVSLILLCGSSMAGAQSSGPRRFALVKSWKGTFNASLPSTVSEGIFQGDDYYCTYTKTRNWTVNGQCTLNLDHTISPPDNMVATWSGEGKLTGSYQDTMNVECQGTGIACLSYTETEESSELQTMEPVADYYFLDINYNEGETLNTYHFVTQNVTFDSNTADTCSGDTDTSIVGFGPFETDYYTPLPASGLTLKGSISNIYASFDNIDELYVPFNWTLVPGDKQDATLEIIKLKQQADIKPGPETDLVFHNGRLVFFAKAKVTPANMADQVQWDVPAIGNESDREIKVTNNPVTGVSKVVVTYKKLPEGNDDFGSKTITASLPDLELSASKDFRVFFERDGTDHPASGGTKSANWYYYWKQGPVPKLDQFTYEDSDKGGYYDWTSHTLTIGKTAASYAFGPMNQPLTDKTGTHSLTLTRDRVEGIEAVAAIVAHELRHKFLVEKVVATDQDHDMIRYEEEEGVEPWTNYEDPNTYGMSASMFYGDAQTYIRRGGPWWKRGKRSTEINTAEEQLSTAGDNEIKAIFAEKSRVCDSAKDWAQPGSQYGQ